MQSITESKKLGFISLEAQKQLRNLTDQGLFILSLTKSLETIPDIEVISSVQNQTLNIFKEASKAYEDSILSCLDKKDVDLDEKLSEILIESSTKLREVLEPHTVDQSAISQYSSLLPVVLFTLKACLESVIDRWLKFYEREFWVMVELGIDEFATMDLYITSGLFEIMLEEKLGCPFVKELVNQTIRSISKKVGLLD
jgi:hypothetical protein